MLAVSCDTEVSEAELGDKTSVKIEPIYTGKIPLIIAGIKAGCGCTETSKLPENPIAPGDYYVIEGKVKTAELSAKKINKYIKIEANTSPYPLMLRIQGEMK
jgi:hypothetical protein